MLDNDFLIFTTIAVHLINRFLSLFTTTVFNLINRFFSLFTTTVGHLINRFLSLFTTTVTILQKGLAVKETKEALPFAFKAAGAFDLQLATGIVSTLKIIISFQFEVQLFRSSFSFKTIILVFATNQGFQLVVL